MKLRDIIIENRLLNDMIKGPRKKIAVIGNITLLNLKEILEFELRKSGLNVDVSIGDYDSLVSDSGRFSSYDGVIIFYEMMNIVEGLHYKFGSYDQEEISRLSKKVETELKLAIKNLKNCPLVLINSFNFFAFDFSPLKKSPQIQFCNMLNEFLEKNISSNQILIDTQMVISKTGTENAFDYRQFQQFKSIYTKDFFVNYSKMIAPAFMSAYGFAKKVLVLDCDNTLWGGVVGEDGPHEIQIENDDLIGKIFYEVQYLIKDLQKRGVLLALCSKNNYSDVEEVFNSNFNMVLKNKDFVAKRINWNDKASNLKSLSEELNLGLDSFVFIDDSEFETNLTKNQLPMVKTVLVPQNLSEYPQVIMDLWKDFFTLSDSSEDLTKTQMYLDQNLRIKHNKSFSTYDDYLASLNLKIKVYWDHDIPIARAAQMTQKTNQFNLRTMRYTEANILQFVGDKNILVGAFSLSDQFGEYGFTGLCIVKISDNGKKTGFIDTFLMSCRVIGRSVEHSFFEAIVSKLKDMQISELEAEFLYTQKNHQVKKLYDNFGLELVEKNQNGRSYFVKLFDFMPKDIKYITTIR